MLKEDYTILKNLEVSFEERKSTFKCNIKRISNEKEAMEFVTEIKGKYKDATHNVFAYVTNNKISMRYSDDGEPQGTAGPPVLEVLKREDINDVVVVITRYFGGILLGAGGLIRAYGASCKQGIDAGVKVKRLEGKRFNITCDYDKYGKVNNYLQGLNVKIIQVTFLENVIIDAISITRDFESIRDDIIQMMCGDNIISDENIVQCFVDENQKIMEV
ncbi:MAG: YigZ family protein [Clostridium sp.]